MKVPKCFIWIWLLLCLCILNLNQGFRKFYVSNLSYFLTQGSGSTPKMESRRWGQVWENVRKRWRFLLRIFLATPSYSNCQLLQDFVEKSHIISFYFCPHYPPFALLISLSLSTYRSNPDSQPRGYSHGYPQTYRGSTDVKGVTARNCLSPPL